MCVCLRNFIVIKNKYARVFIVFKSNLFFVDWDEILLLSIELRYSWLYVGSSIAEKLWIRIGNLLNNFQLCLFKFKDFF